MIWSRCLFLLVTLQGIFAPHHHSLLRETVYSCDGIPCGDHEPSCQIKEEHGQISEHCVDQHHCHDMCTGTTSLWHYGHEGCCCENQTCVNAMKNGQSAVSSTLHCQRCHDYLNHHCDQHHDICHHDQACLIKVIGRSHIETGCAPTHECGHTHHNELTICCYNDSCVAKALNKGSTTSSTHNNPVSTAAVTTLPPTSAPKPSVHCKTCHDYRNNDCHQDPHPCNGLCMVKFMDFRVETHCATHQECAHVHVHHHERVKCCADDACVTNVVSVSQAQQTTKNTTPVQIGTTTPPPVATSPPAVTTSLPAPTTPQPAVTSPPPGTTTVLHTKASTQTSTPSQSTACKDNDHTGHCATLAQMICSSTDALLHQYAVLNCASTCNQCAAYLAATNPITQAATKPATQAVTKPITPSVTKPVTPVVAKPITPAVTKPITPAVTKPITPAVTKPITPAVTKPITPGPAVKSTTKSSIIT